MRIIRSVTVGLTVIALWGCGGGGGGGLIPDPRPTPADNPIKHIVIIIQENRTVDNLFNGLPGADTVLTGIGHRGQTIHLHQVELQNGSDPCHEHVCWVTTYDDGKLDGFDLNNPNGTGPDFDYAYVDKAETAPYFKMAETYTFADRMFQSNSGPSYPAHQYLIAAQSDFVAENPILPEKFNAWGCDSPAGTYTELLGPGGQESPGPFPCFNYPTLADRMDAAGITWRYYAPIINTNGAIWSAFDAIRPVRYGPDWQRNVISPETRFLTDVANGSLAQVTWIAPSGPNSDHSGDGGSSGPSWVTSLVNAIGESPDWDTTAIFITWDDWGGWYDHVRPQQLDRMGLGYRVPLIVISPYAKLAYISHVDHEFGSLMKYTEEQFGLSPLTAVDSRADDLSDCFDYDQAPTPFVKIPAPLEPEFFIDQAPSMYPPDND
jgi:phospholipase C